MTGVAEISRNKENQKSPLLNEISVAMRTDHPNSREFQVRSIVSHFFIFHLFYFFHLFLRRPHFSGIKNSRGKTGIPGKTKNFRGNQELKITSSLSPCGFPPKMYRKISRFLICLAVSSHVVTPQT